MGNEFRMEKPADIQELAQHLSWMFHEYLPAFERYDDIGGDLITAIDWFQQALQSPNVYLIYQDDNIIGYIIYTAEKGEAYIDKFLIREKCRGLKMLRDILKYLREYFKAQDITTIHTAFILHSQDQALWKVMEGHVDWEITVKDNEKISISFKL